MSNTPTPESDDAARKGCYINDPKNYPETCGKQMVHIDIARSLERQRDEARAQVLALRETLEKVPRIGGLIEHPEDLQELVNAALSTPPPPVVKLEDVRPLVEAITSLTNLIICPDDHREENPCRYCDGQTDAENLLKTFLTTYPQLNS